MKLKRSAGILLHISSLPGPFGIGDLGKCAYDFVDWLHLAGQSWWQILPLGPYDHGKDIGNPYVTQSSFAGCPHLISLEDLVRCGDLKREDLLHFPKEESGKIDFREVIRSHGELLHKAAENFLSRVNPPERKAFDEFCVKEASWLEDWALFAAINGHQNNAPWFKWPEGLKLRDSKVLANFREEFGHQILLHKYQQFRFFEQWSRLKKYAHEKSISIFGDLPIYCGHDSADVWAQRKLFKLEPDGKLQFVAGVPPDYFNENGQLWGLPVYNWDVHKSENYSWWISRVKQALRFSDCFRLDHFRGLASYFEIPAEADTAKGGKWEKGPGDSLMSLIKEALGEIPIVAEDLGALDDDVYELRDRWELPGMRVLQFAFGGQADNDHLPFNFVRDSVVYTGTHDNETSYGWYMSHPGKEREHFKKITAATGRLPHYDFIHLAYSSVAALAIVPMQDVLGLGNEARMNYPGQSEGYWRWKMLQRQLRVKDAYMLKDMAELFGR